MTFRAELFDVYSPELMFIQKQKRHKICALLDKFCIMFCNKTGVAIQFSAQIQQNLNIGRLLVTMVISDQIDNLSVPRVRLNRKNFDLTLVKTGN